MNINELEPVDAQRTPEWYTKRALAITGSTIGYVLGMNQWGTADSHLEDRAFQYVFGRVDFDNEAMRYGRKMEPVVLEHSKAYILSGYPDLRYEEDGYRLHREYNWLGASPDMLVVRTDGEIVSGVEVKTQFYRSKKTAKDWYPCRKMTPSYWAQCQLCMHIYDVPTWHFFVSSPSNWVNHEVIYRDPDFIESNMEVMLEWRDRLKARIDYLIRLNDLPENYRDRMDYIKERKPIVNV